MKEKMLAAITGKKVQIWHSLLRDSIEWHYTAQQIRLNAQLLSVNKIQHEFHHHFVPAEYQRGIGERDHILLARSAEFIIKRLQLIAKKFESPRQVSQVNKVFLPLIICSTYMLSLLIKLNRNYNLQFLYNFDVLTVYHI